MKILLILITIILASSVFAETGCYLEPLQKEAQSILNTHMKKLKASSIYRGAQVKGLLDVSDNEGGYETYHFEANIKHVESKYDSKNADLMVSLTIDEKCQVKSSYVTEISAE